MAISPPLPNSEPSFGELTDSFPPPGPLPEDGVALPEANQETPEEEEIPDEIKGAFKDLLKAAREEDRWIRDDQIRLWTRLEYYWNNIIDIFQDPISRDWRVPDWSLLEEEGEVPPRLINIYRPHGEAIVAALSVTIPTTYFHPDDADNPDDLEMAKACRAGAELLALHNDAAMLFIKSLCITFNQGTIFGYNYKHRNPKFGTLETPKVETIDVSIFEAVCPQCGEGLDAGASGQEQSNYQCPTCGYNGPAEVSQGVEKLPQITGFDKSPKSSVCMEVFSGLNVKVPAYVKKQEECGYLLLEFVQSTAMLRSIFQNKADKINSRYETTYEGFAKLPPQYLGAAPDNSSTVALLWLRPWQFWQLDVKKLDLIEGLTDKYKDGCYAIFINDDLMEVFPENMDEHWTISKNPLGQFLYARPLGENLATVQDIRAQLVEIELQTAEYGIPETFVDRKVLDFDKYGEGRAKPGMVTPVKPRPGKSIGDGFFTTKSAVLSQEIDPLRQHIDQDAQFVVGSFPSVYGGPATGGSKTASEYSQSRAVALQRLGNTWKILCNFWSTFEAKATIEFLNVLKDLGYDEKFTKKKDNGVVNVWIRQNALMGKIGHVEPEASEQLPTSWAQKKDELMQLIGLGIPEIISVLVHPNNGNLLKEAVGLKDLYIPGEENRIRQQKEFNVMAQGIPIPTNPEYDDAETHIEVLQGLLEGPLGDELDPQARQICLMHLQEHMMVMQQQAAQNAEQEQASAPEGSEGKDNGRRNKVSSSSR